MSKIVCDNKHVRINITVNRSLFLLFSFQKEKKICKMDWFPSYLCCFFVIWPRICKPHLYYACLTSFLVNSTTSYQKYVINVFLWFIIYLSEIFKPYIFCCVLLLCGFFLNAVIWIIRILRIFKYFFLKWHIL